MICEEENPEYVDYWLCDICAMAYDVDSREWVDNNEHNFNHLCIHCMETFGKEEE